MNSRNKGAGAERELLHLLHECGFPEAYRNDQRWIGGRGNPDIALPGIHLEVKRQERLNIHDALWQARSDSSVTGDMPVVAFRRSREPWTAVMLLDDWLPMYRAWLEGRGANDGARNCQHAES